MEPGRAAAVAAGLWVTSVVGVGLAAYLQWVNRSTDLPNGADAGPGVAFFAGMLVFTTAGAVVAAHRPDNPVGWLLVAEGLAWQLFGLAGQYRVTALFTDDLPGGVLASWYWDWGYLVPMTVAPLLLLLFPDGLLPSRRWRPAASLLVGGAGVLAIALVLRPGDLASTPVTNPTGFGGVDAALDILEAAGNLSTIVGAIGCAVSAVFRYRRAGDLQRHQLKWLAYGGALMVLVLLTATALDLAGVEFVDTGDVRLAALLVLPVAIAVAVLQYRLYDIDVLLSKTIVYATLAALIGLVYVAVVVGLGTVLGVGDEPNIALSVVATAFVAIGFDPARRRLRRTADRLVYGERATPYQVLATFTEQVSAAYPSGDVLRQMAQLVAEASGAAWAEVWLCVGGELRPAGRWPTPHEASARLDAGTLDHPDADRVYRVVHNGQLLGALAVAKPPGEELRPAEDKLLSDVASAAGLALQNAQLIDELKASRQRLVTAQDEERRRVERDLHDGAQRRLLELGLSLAAVHKQARNVGADQVAVAVQAATKQARVALSELRELARGIHPAILVDRGLGPAIESLAERATVPVVVTVDGGRRLPAAVEATAYFVVSEALTNAAKHARAARVDVRVSTDEHRLLVEVTDDGVGSADASGNGLRGLSDRVAALDGRFEVRSPSGRGTRIAMEIPLAACG